MGKGIRNRRELREQYDAAERREGEEVAEEAEETEEDEDEEEEEEAEGGEEEAAAAGADDDDEGGGDDDDDEDAPKPKKKKKVAAPKPVKPKAKPRSRAAKVVRMKVVWKVMNNSNAEVATYDYPKRKEAYDHAARLTTDKKQTHFVQPLKVPMEEKKEKEDGKESKK